MTKNSINCYVTTPRFIRLGQKQWIKEYLNIQPKSIFPSYRLTTTLLHRDPWLCYLIITLCRHYAIVLVVVICLVWLYEDLKRHFLSLFISRATYQYRCISFRHADRSRRDIMSLKTDLSSFTYPVFWFDFLKFHWV